MNYPGGQILPGNNMLGQGFMSSLSGGGLGYGDGFVRNSAPNWGMGVDPQLLHRVRMGLGIANRIARRDT